MFVSDVSLSLDDLIEREQTVVRELGRKDYDSGDREKSIQVGNVGRTG